MQILEQSGAIPSLSADEWTSKSGKRYINVIAHVNEKVYNLGLARIDRAANAVFLGSLVNQKMEQFKINALFMTSDGASVMTAMCSKINLIQQKCFLHGLSLAIRDCLYNEHVLISELSVEESDLDAFTLEDQEESNDSPELVDSLKILVDKVRKEMKTFKEGKIRDELQGIISRKSNEELCIQLDVKTRWNSMLPMLQKFSALFDSIRIHYSENSKDFPFLNSDKEIIDELIDVLTHVEIAIKVIGKESSNLMTADIAMDECLTNLIKKKSTLRQKMHASLSQRYLQRRTINSDILWKLSGMDKMNIQNSFYTNPSDVHISELYKLLFPTQNILTPVDPKEVALNPSKFSSNFVDHEKLCKVLMSIRPSSVSCERCFSLCSRILVPLRGKMNTLSLDSIVFLNQYFKTV